MVGAVEEKPRAAGNRTEFPDKEPVVVHRIVVEHIVALEVHGVGDEIVVYRPLSDLDIRIFDHLFQIDCLPVPFTGIYLFFSHYHAFFCHAGKSGRSSRNSATDYTS